MPFNTVTTGSTITAVWGNTVRDQSVTPFASLAALTSAITVPVVGMLETLTTNASDEGLITYNSAGQWRAPWNMPWGVIDYVQVVAAQTGISTIQNVTSMTRTWTAVARRRYRYDFFCSNVTQQTSAGVASLGFFTSADVLIEQGVLNQASGGQSYLHIAAYETGIAAGSVTRKIRAATTAGTIDLQAGATIPMWFCVTDVGPSGAPS